jgi:TolB-like protein/Flp pilus assembly protein TadD
VQDLTISDPVDKRILFRVGINIGDVIVEQHDIFGDGVNIAARLEGLAEPGGICISSSAYDQVRGKVSVEFSDIGEQTLKNIARPVRVYALTHEGGGRPSIATAGQATTSVWAPRLSIVVLPFANIGGDPEQDYFVDGVTESLTTDLSRITGSFVIARNSAFSYKGKSIDVRQVGRELNVRYVLEGSVQRGGSRFRVNVQLIDAETGNHIWAERFDKPVADLFDVQDEIVARLANTLTSQLVEVEARRTERKPHPDATDLYFQGWSFANKGITPEYMMKARNLFERALALDSENIEAMVGLASIDLGIAANHLADDGVLRLAGAETVLNRALSLDPKHARAHMFMGVVHIYTNRGLEGIARCEQALTLDRNLANAHGFIGLGKNFLGRGEETETHVKEAIRLSPRDIYAYWWMTFVAGAKLQLNSDAEAVIWFRRSIEMNPNWPLSHFLLAAALALLGSPNEAQAAARAGLALDPSFTLRRYRSLAASEVPVVRATGIRIAGGMRVAGVPDG